MINSASFDLIPLSEPRNVPSFSLFAQKNGRFRWKDESNKKTGTSIGNRRFRPTKVKKMEKKEEEETDNDEKNKHLWLYCPFFVVVVVVTVGVFFSPS